MGYGTLATLIIAMVVLFVLLGYTSTFANVLKKGSDVEICKLSVLAHAQSKFLGETPVQLKCPRREVKLFNNKVEINRKKDSKYEFNQLNEEVVNKVIAEELRLCWYKMGEGYLNVFRQDAVDSAVIYTSGENICLICSEISFDKKITNKKFSGLVNFLKSNKPQGEDYYYFDYLIRSQRNLYLLWGNIPWTQYTPWGWGTTDKITNSLQENMKKYQDADSDFRADQSYVIYFLGWKPAWLQEKFGQSTSAYYIGLSNPEKVAKECRMLVN